MEKINRKIIVIVGPTASGKTGIGVRLAKELNGEIISADSRQVYCGLDLGTGKDLAEYGGIKYHLIDICEPGERFTLFDYLPRARAAIDDIFNRGNTPIIVGGTGLYVQALTEGFELDKIQNTNNSSTSLRAGGIQQTRGQLESLTVEQLQNILKKIDPQSFEKIDINNSHRLIRAIERAQEGNSPTKIKPNFKVLQIGINWPREQLYSRIDRRVEERFEQGMLKEVSKLLIAGVNPEWLISLGLEYREITNYLTKKNVSFEEMKQVLKYKIHQFARRQLTWFRRFPEITWENDYKKILKKSKQFLEKK